MLILWFSDGKVQKLPCLCYETVNHFSANFILFWIGFHAKAKTAQEYRNSYYCEFAALGFVIDKIIYNIAGQMTVLQRIRALLKYQMIVAWATRSKYFYVDFVSSMASKSSISSGSVHAVSIIIVKMAYWNRKKSSNAPKKQYFQIQIEVTRQEKKYFLWKTDDCPCR